MIQIRNYVRATSLDEAYELNQKKNNVIIGGMHWLKMGTKSYGTAIDLSGLGLDQIIETEEQFEIGCMATLSDIEMHEGLNAYCGGAVRDAVKDIVGVQFRNTATVGGSIYGRYGFSDVLAVFMALDATVVLHKGGEIAISDYAKMKADRDIVVKLIVRKQQGKFAYQAVRRQKTDFPVLAAAVSCINGQWTAVLSARPERAVAIRDVEGILSCYACGSCQAPSEEAAKKFGEYVADNTQFGSNMRGSAEYRKTIASVLVKRAVLSMIDCTNEVAEISGEEA